MARKVVYGPIPWSNMVIARGVEVFAGVKLVPHLEELKVFSSDPRDAVIYNRYGYISGHDFATLMATMNFGFDCSISSTISFYMARLYSCISIRPYT